MSKHCTHTTQIAQVVRADIAGVQLHGDGLPSSFGRQADDLFGLCLIGAVGEDRIDAALGEAQRGIAAQAATTTCHDGDFGR